MTDNIDEIRAYGCGRAHVAPKGTTAPADATTSLDAAFGSLGHLSGEGFEEGAKAPGNITDHRDSCGRIVKSTVKGDRSHEFKVYPMQTTTLLNRHIHGDENATAAVVTEKGLPGPMSVWALEAIETLADGSKRLVRIVIEEGQVKGHDAIQYKDGEELTVANFTITATPDANGTLYTKHYAIEAGA